MLGKQTQYRMTRLHNVLKIKHLNIAVSSAFVLPFLIRICWSICLMMAILQQDPEQFTVVLRTFWYFPFNSHI